MATRRSLPEPCWPCPASSWPAGGNRARPSRKLVPASRRVARRSLPLSEAPRSVTGLGERAEGARVVATGWVHPMTTSLLADHLQGSGILTPCAKWFREKDQTLLDGGIVLKGK